MQGISWLYIYAKLVFSPMGEEEEEEDASSPTEGLKATWGFSKFQLYQLEFG